MQRRMQLLDGPPAGLPAGGAFPGTPLSAADLPGTRNQLIASYSLPAAQNRIREEFTRRAAAGTGRRGGLGALDPGADADLMIRDELVRLRDATLYWASPDVTARCMAAAPGMQAPAPGRLGDLPARVGLLYFAPAAGNGDGWRRRGAGPGLRRQLGSPGGDGHRPGGGTWFTFYAAGPSLLARWDRAAEIAKLGLVNGPARDLPVSSPAVEHAVEMARHGVITHLTAGGERVAAIVPEPLIEALHAAEDAEDAAEADAAMDEPGEPVPWEQVKAEFDL